MNTVTSLTEVLLKMQRCHNKAKRFFSSSIIYDWWDAPQDYLSDQRYDKM